MTKLENALEKARAYTESPVKDAYEHALDLAMKEIEGQKEVYEFQLHIVRKLKIKSDDRISILEGAMRKAMKEATSQEGGRHIDGITYGILQQALDGGKE